MVTGPVGRRCSAPRWCRIRLTGPGTFPHDCVGPRPPNGELHMSYARYALGALVVLGAIYFPCRSIGQPTNAGTTAGANGQAVGQVVGGGAVVPAVAKPAGGVPAPGKLLPFVEHALDWLAGAQQKDGGWGAGSNARQDIRDAHAVPTDPATTAVAAIALMRAGNGLDRGEYAETLRRATEYLLRAVETAKD